MGAALAPVSVMPALSECWMFWNEKYPDVMTAHYLSPGKEQSSVKVTLWPISWFSERVLERMKTTKEFLLLAKPENFSCANSKVSVEIGPIPTWLIPLSAEPVTLLTL